MNIENIKLAGMSFEEYKALRDVINKDAAKIIAENIDKANIIVK